MGAAADYFQWKYLFLAAGQTSTWYWWGFSKPPGRFIWVDACPADPFADLEIVSQSTDLTIERVVRRTITVRNNSTNDVSFVLTAIVIPNQF